MTKRDIIDSAIKSASGCTNPAQCPMPGILTAAHDSKSPSPRCGSQSRLLSSPLYLLRSTDREETPSVIGNSIMFANTLIPSFELSRVISFNAIDIRKTVRNELIRSSSDDSSVHARSCGWNGKRKLFLD